MNNYTLVIIDLQEKIFHNLKDKSIKDKIIKVVHKAMDDMVGVVVCSYDVEKLGETCSFVLDILKPYMLWLGIEYFEKPVGDEILSVCRQREFDRKNLRLIGLGDLEKSRHRCAYLTNFQNSVELL